MYPGLNLVFLTKHITVLSCKCMWLEMLPQNQNYYCKVVNKSQVNPFNIETEDADEPEDLFRLVRV